MKRNKRLIIGICLAAFIVYAVMTGGLTFYAISDFGGQRPIPMEEGVTATAWLGPQSTYFGVPLVLHYYGMDGPFDLRLQLSGKRDEHQSVEITEIVLEYEGGQIVRKNEGWSSYFEPHTITNSSRSGITRTEIFEATKKIEGLVPRHENVKITVKGELVKSNRERARFETSSSFRAASQFGVVTYWDVLASC